MKRRPNSFIYQASAIAAGFLNRKRKFMNLGYSGDTEYTIKPEDQNDAHHISLYLKLLSLVPDLKEKARTISALEIGCGRGGGCYVMKNYFGIKEITGIDLSSGNIKLTSRFMPSSTFIKADATEFNTGKTYDLIVNLESAHAYSSLTDFFKCAVASMNTNADFIFGDLIHKKRIENLEKMMADNGLQIIKSETINDEVVRSIEKNSPKHYPLATRFPFLFPQLLHSFFVTIHSKTYLHLKKENILYRIYLLKKAN